MNAEKLQSVQGPQGAQGESSCKPGNIRHWYTSIAELEADFTNPDIAMYDLAAINSNDTAEDGRMYYKGATEWVFVTTLKEKKGEPGIQGILPDDFKEKDKENKE